MQEATIIGYLALLQFPLIDTLQKPLAKLQHWQAFCDVPMRCTDYETTLPTIALRTNLDLATTVGCVGASRTREMLCSTATHPLHN